MDFRDLIRVIKVNLPLIVSSVIIVFLGASILTFAAAPVYSSNVRLFVSIPGSSLDISSLAVGSSFAESRVKSYAKIVDGPLTLTPVIKKLNLNYSVAQLASMVNADAPVGTVLIDITVENSDANLASNIANAIGAQFAITAGTLEFASDGVASPVKVTMVKFATPSSNPSSPNKAANLAAGAIFGFGLGIGLSLLRRLLDSTVKNEVDLNDLPLLTAVPFDKNAVKSPLITQVDKYSIRVEAFRLLRTNLQFLSPERPPKVISIASALPGEGKTTTAINISISLVLAGFKVLLLECDLRRPRVSTYLGIAKSDKGITELITSRSSINFNQYVRSYSPNPKTKLKLDFIPSGQIPPNPSELLNSYRFESLIKNCSKNYDYVIIDSPPILPVSDASLIATHVDGVLLVIHAGQTKKTQYRGAIDALQNVNSKALGVMLNMIPADSRRAQDYGYKYGYAGEYSNSSKYGYDYGYNYGQAYGYGGKKEMLAYAPQDQIPPKIEISEQFSKIIRKIRNLKEK